MDKLKFNYEDKILDVDIIYKKRKNISIKIIPKYKIQIIAPNKVDIKVLEEVLEKSSKWIKAKLDKFKTYNDLELKRDYVDGEIYYYLGRAYYLKILKDKSVKNKNDYCYINLIENFIEIRTNNWGFEHIKTNLKKWYKLQSEKIVLDRIEKLKKESISFRNIEPSLVKIKEQKTIWGSCNVNKTIYLNSKIAMLPVFAIDYIIAHEFCHILYLNHSKSFYLEVEKIIPDYKATIDWLRQNNYKFKL